MSFKGPEKTPIVEVRSDVSAGDDHAEKGETPQTDAAWAPGFFKRFPWIGFSALFAVICCSVGSIITLVTSDGVSQSHWPEQVAPNVLLNIMNSVANICFTVAIGNGVAIAWWRKTLKGTTIEDLHRSWSFSTSLKEIVFSLKYFNIIALATLAAKLTIIDGSLMQRATSTVTRPDPPVAVDNIFGYANHTFPFNGITQSYGVEPGTMLQFLNNDLKIWSSTGGLLPNHFSNCSGTCFLDVPAMGLQMDCTEPMVEQANYQLTMKQIKAIRNGATVEGPSLFNLTFTSTTSYNDTTKAYDAFILMKMAYAQMHPDPQNYEICPTSYYTQSCKLLPALINYPVQLSNFEEAHSQNGLKVGVNLAAYNNRSGATDGLYNKDMQQLNGFQVLKREYPTTEVYDGQKPSVVSGLVQAFDMYLAGESRVSYWNYGTFTAVQTGFAPQYLANFSDSLNCGYWYNSPLIGTPNQHMPSVLTKINEITFAMANDLSGALVTPELRHSMMYNATMYIESIHYVSNYYYMAGAIASTMLCVLLVAPTFWGFWELGRKVTLGPFEIAHAFRSPMTAQVHHGTIDNVVKEVGQQKIRYGHIVSGDAAGAFAIASPENIANDRPVLTVKWTSCRDSSGFNVHCVCSLLTAFGEFRIFAVGCNPLYPKCEVKSGNESATTEDAEAVRIR